MNDSVVATLPAEIRREHQIVESVLKQFPSTERGRIYHAVTIPEEVKRIESSLISSLEINKISLVFIINTNLSYERDLVSKTKELYYTKNCKTISFIVIDQPPSEFYIDEYERHGPRNLVKLVNFIFLKIQCGENVLLDVSQKSNILNLIIAALSRKMFSLDSDASLKWCKENISQEFNLSDVHENHLSRMDFSAEKVALPEPFLIPELKGNIYRGVLPRDAIFDEGAYFELMRKAGIERVITLNEAPEIEVGSCTDLISLYKENGFEVIHFPIQDYGTPDLRKLKEFISQLEITLADGKKTMIHCWSGNGRTGLLLGCYAVQTLKISGLEAVRLIRSYIPAALETEKQQDMVAKFE